MKRKTDEEIIELVFSGWFEMKEERKRVRSLMQKVFGSSHFRQLSAALYKWRYGKFESEPSHFDDYVINGRGGRLLLEAEVLRQENIEALGEIIHATNQPKVSHTQPPSTAVIYQYHTTEVPDR